MKTSLRIKFADVDGNLSNINFLDPKKDIALTDVTPLAQHITEKELFMGKTSALKTFKDARVIKVEEVIL